MRVPYKFVLGLLLFNVVFALTSGIFNTGYDDEAVGLDENTVSQYDLAHISVFSFLQMIFFNAAALSSAGIITGIALTAAWLTKNYVYIGTGIFVSIIIGMYVSFINIISQIVSGATHDNVYVVGLVTAIGISIGVIVMFNVVDMFAPAPAQ